MTDLVRYALPWNWDELEEDAIAESWRRLSGWVSWFVSRYCLTRRVPDCWWRHPELADELRSLFYYHQEVTAPLVKMPPPDPAGGPQQPEHPPVTARSHWEWHEARQRWTAGPLRAAPSYSECLSKGKHVDYDYEREDAGAFAEAGRLGIDQAAKDGELRA